MRSIVISIITFLTIFFFNNSYSQVKVTSDGNLHVDYSSNDNCIAIGENLDSRYTKGRWGIEHFSEGLNFWIPWPNVGSGNYKLFLENSSGYVGINDDNPSYHLDVNGDIQLSGQIRYYSDENLKTNIKDIGGTIEKVKELKGVSYKMKKSKTKNYDLTNITDPIKIKTIEAEMARNDSIEETDRYGFIAQDIQKIFPELVNENDEGLLNVDYVGLIPVLVEAIKELEGRVDILENDCCNKSSSLKSGSLLDNETVVKLAKLYQNSPNPFSVQTKINFEVSESVQNVQLHICNMTGTLLKTIQINQKGAGNVTISANEFNAGMYLYSLVCDGKIVDTKQMLLTE